MESRILNVSAVRRATASTHFVAAATTSGYLASLQRLHNEKTIRSLQYTIPAVSQHYGNAFATDEDGEEGAEESGVVNHSTIGHPLNAHRAATIAYFSADMKCDEEEEQEEDVEMSPAIEVIAIDPSCDYDSEEEKVEDDEEQEEDGEEKEEDEEEKVDGAEKQEGELEHVLSKGNEREGEDYNHQIHQIFTHTHSAEIKLAVELKQDQSVRILDSEHPIVLEEQVALTEIIGETPEDQLDMENRVIESLETDDIEPELQNLHRDSDEDDSDNESISSSSSSNSSTSSSTSSSSSCSSSSSNYNSDNKISDNKNDGNTRCDSSSRTSSKASSHPSDYVCGSDQETSTIENRENLAKVIERRKLMAIERRKRTTSLNRKSFSLPHSPVAGAGDNLMHDMTSLSFEDLDMSGIVNDLSPLKNPLRACESDDKLVQELAENNFDLAAYITEDDFVTTDSASGHSDSSRHKKEQHKTSPVKKQPKSCGKQIKMLRELMISPKNEHNATGNTRRSCTNKARRIVENSDSATEESESETDSRVCVKIFGIERTIGKAKRKEDDMKADPTWNPTTNTPKFSQRGIHNLKTIPVPPATVQQTTSRTDFGENKQLTIVKTNESIKPNPLLNIKKQTANAGVQSARSKILSLVTKNSVPTRSVKHKPHNKSNTQTVVKTVDQKVKNKLPATANVKLDHDYCSPKKSIGQNVTMSGPQRKAIEIPFLLPTLDQMRQKKRLSKVKTRSERNDKKTKSGVLCDKKNQKTYTSNSTEEKKDEAKVTPNVNKETSVVLEKPIKDVKHPLSILRPTQPVVQQKQVSLLKINQNKPNGLQTTTITAITPNVGNEKLKSEPQLINANSSSSNESIVKVKKKLNLQEYKKRRELPTDEATANVITATESNSKCSISSVSTICESSSKEEINGISQHEDRHVQPSEFHQSCTQNCSLTCNEYHDKIPLDPILAAKHKALRMQQLKKEAAIKSTEAKIIPKIVPQIVPLAEITSIKFDEDGNPIPYHKSHVDSNSGMKLHEDYEEIIIVSMGCNTEITINPRETKNETVKIKESSKELQEKNIPKNELLSNITDTIKRCQSSAPAIISSSSLISSIHEMVIKKKSYNKDSDRSVLNAATIEKQPVGGGQANQQSSPDIGISPPNVYSPGKPEKASGAYEQSPSFEYDEAALLQTKNSGKITQHGEDKVIMHLRKDRERTKGVAVAIQTLPLDRFPELKTLTPVKKERTVSRNSCASLRRSRSRQSYERRVRDRSRRQYRRRRSRSSSSEHEAGKRSSQSYRSSSKRSSSSRYSKSRSSSRRKSRSRSRSRSRSYRRRSRSNSRRRRRSRSNNRRCYYDRGYSSRHRDRRRSVSISSYSDSSSSCSRSRSRSSRGTSLSSSRPTSRNRIRSRNEYRKQTSSPERKIVYVGRLESTLKREDLRRKFIKFGRIKQVTIHYKESGAKYGFVTFEKPQDAYKAIDTSSKDPTLSDYDVSFGGRRAFCRTEYADLDGDLSQDQEGIPYVARDGTLIVPPAPVSTLARKEENETFEDMLKKLKREISAKKPRKS